MVSAVRFLPQDDVDAEAWQGFKNAWITAGEKKKGVD